MARHRRLGVWRQPLPCLLAFQCLSRVPQLGPKAFLPINLPQRLRSLSNLRNSLFKNSWLLASSPAPSASPLLKEAGQPQRLVMSPRSAELFRCLSTSRGTQGCKEMPIFPPIFCLGINESSKRKIANLNIYSSASITSPERLGVFLGLNYYRCAFCCYL